MAFTFMTFLHFTTSSLISCCAESKLLWTGTMSHSSSGAQNQTQSLAHHKYSTNVGGEKITQRERKKVGGTEKAGKRKAEKMIMEFFLATLGTQYGVCK